MAQVDMEGEKQQMLRKAVSDVSQEIEKYCKIEIDSARIPGSIDEDVKEVDVKDFVADFHDIQAAVRVRDGEFLIGVGGAEDGLWTAVSADATNLDPVLMGEWRERLEGIFGELEREEMGKVGPSL